jgi:hypothetical protein
MQGAPSQLSELPSYLVYILLDPTLNPRAAFLLYGSIALILLIILVIAVMIIMRSTKEDETSSGETPAGGGQREALGVREAAEGSEPGGGSELTTGPGASGRGRGKPSKPPMGSLARLAVAAGIVLVLVAAWTLTGYTTSNPALCKNCHWPASEHAKAPVGTDPHAHVSCVSCHEPGGAVGRYLSGVPARLIHFAVSQSSTPLGSEYGRITVAACSYCHAAALAAVATNETRGLKVSHKEPLAASATCIDCHRLRAGVVGTHNAGMTPCLRCHDAKHASAECDSCHDEKAASAARARTTSFADEQIPYVSCGGCHNEKRDCDTCHGIRLPHSPEFMAYAHARAGAVDFWYNGGKTCSRCHTASRRPCQRCHGTLLGRAHGTTPWLALGHRTAAASACNTCHLQYAYSSSRDFCKDLCHTPAAVDASPR